MVRAVPTFCILVVFFACFTYAVPSFAKSPELIGDSGFDLSHRFQGLSLLQNMNGAAPVTQGAQQQARRVAASIVHWVVVPAILIIIFVFAVSLPYTAGKTKDSSAGTAGIFAGLIIFLIFLVTRDSQVSEFSSEIPEYSLSFFSVIIIAAGLILGFGTITIINEIRKLSSLAFLVMILVAATLITGYSYFVYVGLRSIVVYISLGGMLGGLLRIMIDTD